MKDKRENKEKRAIKVKTKGDTFLSTNEMLKFQSGRRKAGAPAPWKPGLQDVTEEEGENLVTFTGTL